MSGPPPAYDPNASIPEELEQFADAFRPRYSPSKVLQVQAAKRYVKILAFWVKRCMLAQSITIILKFNCTRKRIFTKPQALALIPILEQSAFWKRLLRLEDHQDVKFKISINKG